MNTPRRIAELEARLGIGATRLVLWVCERLGNDEALKAPPGAIVIATGVPRREKR